MFEETLTLGGENEVGAASSLQLTGVHHQVYAIEVDIGETMGELLAHAGEALSLDLTHYKVTVLGEKHLGHEDTLQDQCGTQSGPVQVHFAIHVNDECGGVLDIQDVLKSTGDESSQEDGGEEENGEEGEGEKQEAEPVIDTLTVAPRRTQWVVSSEFREIQKKCKMPRDPRQWSAAEVQVWLAWARQYFPEVAPYDPQNHQKLDGALIMSLTPTQLILLNVLAHNDDESGPCLFITHRDLLKQTGAAALCKQPSPLPSPLMKDIQITSGPECIQQPSTPSPPPTTVTATPAAVSSGLQKSQPVQLWQFILELLTEPKLVKIISWWDCGIDGQFRLHQPEVVATLWGQRKGRTNMTYNKLSRALRYYYEGDMIAKVVGKRFVYRFVLDLKHVVGYSAVELKSQMDQFILQYNT